MLGRMVPHQRSARMHMYAPLLSQLRLVLVARMAKPEEVLVVEDGTRVLCEIQSKKGKCIAVWDAVAIAIAACSSVEHCTIASILFLVQAFMSLDLIQILLLLSISPSFGDSAHTAHRYRERRNHSRDDARHGLDQLVQVDA